MNRRGFLGRLLGAAMVASTRWLPVPAAPVPRYVDRFCWNLQPPRGWLYSPPMDFSHGYTRGLGDS